MNANNAWIQAWTSAAEQRRQRIADALSRPPPSPLLRARYVRMAEALVNKQKAWAERQKNWAEAYYEDRDSLSQILSGSPVGGGTRYGSGDKTRGNLGE